MAKQKVVMEIRMNDPKSRSKAMKNAVGLPADPHSEGSQGVISATLDGSDKDQLVVVGEGVDSVELTTLLRKKMGFAKLVSVTPVDDKKKDDEKKASNETVVLPTSWAYQYYGGHPQYMYEYQDPNRDSCCIM